MGRVIFAFGLIVMTLAPGVSVAIEGIEAVTATPVLPFREALHSAELIFLGQVERVEEVKPRFSGDYDRRAFMKVLEHFNGPELKEVFVYFRSKRKGDNTDAPVGIENKGEKLILFTKDGPNYTTSVNDNSFMFPFYPKDIGRPQLHDCIYRALTAYRNKRPIEEVLEIERCVKKPAPGPRGKKVKFGSEEHLKSRNVPQK